jgi:hypothetical protein
MHRRSAIDVSLMHSGIHQYGGVNATRITATARRPISPARFSRSYPGVDDNQSPGACRCGAGVCTPRGNLDASMIEIVARRTKAQ